MIKYYCDRCGNELSKSDHYRIKRELVYENHRLCVEVITGLDGCSNAGHFCHKCVTEAVNEALRAKGGGDAA